MSRAQDASWPPAGPGRGCCSPHHENFPSMIILKNVTVRRGSKVLLDKTSATLNPGEKVGLVGRNGAGKSSLFARSEEHTSELQSLMRSSYAVFCLKKKNKQ